MYKIKKQINALKIEVWEFVIIRNTLYLDKYYTAEKESTRHRKYKKILYYDRIMNRNNTIAEEEIPLSNDIKEEALSIYFNQVKCIKWSERHF